MPDFYTFKWLGFSGQGQNLRKTKICLSDVKIQ
jgi:hypothetical protein